MIPNYLLVSIYSSFIQSHITYGNLAWASPYTSKLDLNKLVHKAHKTIKNLTPAKLLTIDQLYKIECCKLIYEFQKETLPHNIHVLFNKANHIHSHRTRQATNSGLHVPYTIHRAFPLLNLASKNWNELCAPSFKLNISKSTPVKALAL